MIKFAFEFVCHAMLLEIVNHTRVITKILFYVTDAGFVHITHVSRFVKSISTSVVHRHRYSFYWLDLYYAKLPCMFLFKKDNFCFLRIFLLYSIHVEFPFLHSINLRFFYILTFFLFSYEICFVRLLHRGALSHDPMPICYNSNCFSLYPEERWWRPSKYVL